MGPAVQSFLRRAAPWVLLVVGIYWLSGPGGSGGAAEFPLGGRLPDLTIDLADGTRLVVPPRSRGSEVLILNFWASYCAPCRVEAPILSSLSAREAGAIRVIGLGIEDMSRANLLRAAEDLGMRYPIAAADRELLDRLRIRAVPTTYVIAKDGVITLSRVGAVSERELEAAIASAKRRG
jgi:thiol-disulfide isomerase/thioredoxin